jgi:CHAD domain-containing protein
LDVLDLLIEELQPDTKYRATALERVRAAVIHAREASRKQLAANLPTTKLKRLADKLDRAGKTLDSKCHRSEGYGRVSRWVLEARLTRRVAVARSAIERAGALYVPERLHDVRIALKKLRYAAELMSEVERRRVTADIAALKSAQDPLGRLHDLQVLLTSARDVHASLSPPDLTLWRDLGLLVRAIEGECRSLHARYLCERAKLLAIADRIGAAKPRVEAASYYPSSRMTSHTIRVNRAQARRQGTSLRTKQA